MEKKIGVAILGGTGYGAGELLRLLASHPHAEVVSVVSSSQAGQAVAKLHPHLQGFYTRSFDSELDFSRFADFEHSVIFAGLPHGASAKAITALLAQAEKHGTKIIDLSGDFRLRDQAQRKEFYPDAKISTEVQKQFVYGLTELYRKEIISASHISNPGCLSSACILAAAPLAAHFGMSEVSFDAKTGSSGAGRKAQAAFHHPETHADVRAYKILEHRHEPEIAQALADCAKQQVATAFVPHVIPAARGIYVTAHLSLAEPAKSEDLLQCYKTYYQDSPFIRVRESIPQLHQVVLSNFCDLYVKARGKQVIAVSALDNLVKGMAGQAIQNMNLLCGFSEESGLWQPSPGPM